MLVDLHSLARVLGGEVCRNQVLAPALGHSPKDRSLSVRFDPDALGGFLVHCFGIGDPLVEKERIRAILKFDQSRLDQRWTSQIKPAPGPLCIDVN
jgi:hypothetical protein